MYRNRIGRSIGACVFLLAPLVVLGAPLCASAKDALRIVLVVDTKAANVGDSMKVNRKLVENAINEVYNDNPTFFKPRMSVTILKDDKVNPNNIRALLARIPLDRSDRVLFYYCGHGAWSPKLGHFLATSGGDITRNEIRHALNSRAPKAAFILTDCCSNYARFTFAWGGGVNENGPRPMKPRANWRVFKNLFYDAEGIVDCTAAKEGEFAWGNSATGGFFTSSLVACLRKPAKDIRGDGKDGPVSWSDFAARLKEETLATFKSHKNGAPKDSEIKKEKYTAQTAYAFSLGGWPVQFTKRLVLKNNSKHKIRVSLQVYDRDCQTLRWHWFPGRGQWLVFDLAPGDTLTPQLNGFPIEAHTFVRRVVSLSNPRVKGSSKVWQTVPRGGYRGQLQDVTLSLSVR